MFVLARANVLFRADDGTSFRIYRDQMGTVPAWVSDSAYFKALVKDGKILVTESTSDKAIAAAEKKAEKKAKKEKV